jgi:diguanylate cyclase (GGDEF)-like protein/PAS domain S-box-containing protein
MSNSNNLVNSIETAKDDQMTLLFKLSLALIDMKIENQQEVIEDALEKIAQFSKADRVYIFEYNFQTNTASNTYEWCKKDITPQIDSLQNIPLELLGNIVNVHKSGGYVHIPDVSALEDEAFKNHLQKQQIQSLLVLPMKHNEECLGFVGFDRCSILQGFSNNDVNILKLFTKLMVTVQEQRDAEKKAKVMAQRYESERILLKSLINSIPDLIWLKDEHGVYLSCNKRFESFFGAKEDEIVGKTDYDFVDKKLADFFREHDDNAMHRDKPTVNEENITFASDGHQEYLETIKSPMKNEKGELIGIVGVGRNISQRKAYERELEYERKKFRYLLDHATDALHITDMQGNIVDCSNSFAHMLGYTKEEALQLHVFDWSVTASNQKEKHLKEILEEKQSRFETLFKRKDGSILDAEVLVSLIELDGKDYLYASARDVTKLHNMNELLKEQSMTDELTKLYNRKAYNLKLNEMLSEYKRYKTVFSLLMFDIDHFKVINDTHGHALGDEVLIKLSKVVKSIIRSEDHLFRIGGEEFTVLLSKTNLEHAKQIAEKIRKTVEQRDDILKNASVTISIGIAEVRESDSIDSIFVRADNNLYYAKENGRNQISYHLL